MAITSENKTGPFQGYQNSQFRYAFTYVVITLAVLIFLNIYCYQASQRLFYESKETALIEKCQLASDEIAQLEVLNTTTVSNAVSQMGSLKVTRLIVTDQEGLCLYDTTGQSIGAFVLLPEVMESLDGNDVFSWQYHDGAMISRAATPMQFYGTTIGCVYISEYDTSQGNLIQLLQRNILTITIILELFVILFSIFFTNRFSLRMRKIMHSMKIIQDGSFTQKVTVGGNDELTLLADEFNLLTDRLKTSEEKRNRFVSDASHELKTPLASIKLLTDSILQNEMDTQTMREFVGDIGSEADRLTRMSGKLLSLAKLDSEDAIEDELNFMEPTIRSVAKMLTGFAAKASVTMELDTKADSTILISEDDLYQIVFNLMENGIKYNRPGGTLYVTLSKEDDFAVLTIRDTGMGIPQDAVDHIFERFYRVDKARSRATGGSGLGLAIVRAMIRRNRGEIQVESVLGEGTTFRLMFPAFETEVDKP